MARVEKRRGKKRLVIWLLVNSVALLPVLYGLKCIVTLNGRCVTPLGPTRLTRRSFGLAPVEGEAAVLAGLGYIALGVFAYLSGGSEVSLWNAYLLPYVGNNLRAFYCPSYDWVKLTGWGEFSAGLYGDSELFSHRPVTLGTIHNRGGNMAFLDGHVEWAHWWKWIEFSDAAARRWNYDNQPHREHWKR